MTSFRRALKSGRLIAAVLAVALISGASAHGQVLDQVPGDSLVVVKVNHLQDTSAKVAAFMQALGVTDFQPALNDPLAAVMSQSGLTAGIDKSGEMAMAWLNRPWSGTQKDANGKQVPPPVLILVPVSDYKAFVEQSTVVRTEGDVSVVHFKQDKSGEDTFIANWGAYAAMSPTKDVVTAKPDGLKATGLAAKQLAEKDAIIFVNMPALKAMAIPQLQANRQKILNEVQKTAAAGNPGAGPNQAAVLKSVVNQVINMATTFMQDSQATTIGINVGKDGITGTLLAEFVPDSATAKLVAQVKNTDQPLMAGLPDNKYLFYGGMVQDPALSVKIIDGLAGSISTDIAGLGENGKLIQEIIDNTKEGMSAIEGSAFGMVAPTGAIGQGGLVELVGVYKGDAAKLQAVQKTQVEAQQKLMKAMSMKSGEVMKTSYLEGAKTIDGISFNQVQMQPNMQGNTPQEMQAAQAMSIMYGPNGLVMLNGIIDPKTLLVVGGGDDQLISSAIAAAKSNTDVLGSAEALKSVDANLPKTRAAVVYIPLDVIVSTAVSYARQFGFPMPVQLPPNLPPIGISAGTEGSAIRVDEHVPTQLVQSLIQAGMQVFLQMRGGGGQGGGGGAGGAGGL